MKSIRLLWCLVIAVTAMPLAALVAAPPTLTVPAAIKGQVGDFIQVPATTTGKNVTWLAIDPGLNLFPVNLLRDTKTAVVSSRKPGAYRLLAITAVADEISAPAICTITIEGDAPAPAPQPNPAPNPAPPAPAPAAKAAWAIVVLDNTQRTQAVGQLVASATLIQALQAAKVQYRVFDVADPIVSQNHYDTSAKVAGGVPALILFDAVGKRIKAVPLPATEAAFLAAIPVAAVPPTAGSTAAGRNDCPV